MKKERKVYITIATENRQVMGTGDYSIEVNDQVKPNILWDQVASCVQNIFLKIDQENNELKKPKRFWLFRFDDYYPGGGMHDFVGKYDSLEEIKNLSIVKNHIPDRGSENIQIWDSEKWEEVERLVVGGCSSEEFRVRDF